MRDKEYREHDRPEDLLQELGYETQDIHYKKFSVYGIYFFGFLTVSALAGFVILYFMSPTGLHGGNMVDYVPKTDMPAATPLLQSNITARTDIMSLRRKESDVLYSAAVVDQKNGVYRIPIDQAIDEISKHGLPKTAPVQSNGQATPSTAVGGADQGSLPYGLKIETTPKKASATLSKDVRNGLGSAGLFDFKPNPDVHVKGPGGNGG